MLQQFDAAGRREQTVAAIGAIDDFVNDYDYDNLGRMTGLTQQDQAGGNAVADKRVDFGYDAAGQWDFLIREKGQALSYLHAAPLHD